MTETQFIFGYHAVLSMLEHRPDTVRALYLDENQRGERQDSLIKAAKIAGIIVTPKPRIELERLAGAGAVHQGVVAKIINAGPSQSLAELMETLSSDALVLVLDGIQDPHNLGACLRSADAAGVHAVIVPKDKAAPLTPVARKAASGAAERLALYPVTNLARTLQALKAQGLWLVGTADDAELSLYDADLTGPVALVMGAEGKGLRRLTRECCDYLVHIPVGGSVSSLNVSVATGICLFEARRQRNQAGS